MTDLPTTRVIDLESAQIPEVPKGVEAELTKKLKQRARLMCHPTIEKYYECTHNKTFSVIWACRSELKEMNECLKQKTTDDELNKFKVEWVRENAEAWQKRVHDEMMNKKMPLGPK